MRCEASSEARLAEIRAILEGHIATAVAAEPIAITRKAAVQPAAVPLPPNRSSASPITIGAANPLEKPARA